MTKILIAEDAEDIRELLSFKLKAAGYEVHTVADGESAVAFAKSILPDLVVLDWMMPRMNGLDACIALRSDPNFRSVPIMFLTAKGQEIDVERGFSAGVDDYVVKPFSPRELVHRIEALLARTRSSSIEAFIARTNT
jgi:two-component system phosphate regulon response regulator PhoB